MKFWEIWHLEIDKNDADWYNNVINIVTKFA